jgi:hypothetical protein
MKSKSRRKHRSKDEKYYIPYLPDEVFNNLTPQQREIQREYRLYHRVVHDIKKRIKDNQNLKRKLSDKIRDDKNRLKERANDDYQDRGYEELMLKRYQKISHLYEDYNFLVNIAKVNRTSKSHKQNEDDMKNYGFINSTVGNFRKKVYKGKELTEVFHYHAQIKSKDFDYSRIKGLSPGKDKKVKTISLSTEESMRTNLGLIFDEDWSKDSIEDVRSEWEFLIRAFINWYLTTHGWKSLKTTSISKDKLTEWLIKVGVNEKNSEFQKWISKEG